MSINTELFVKYASSGNLIEAQNYYSLKISLKKCGSAFTNACIDGHLNVAQWLYSIKPNINLYSNNERIFTYTCIDGHLDIAQWLYSIKPDINSANDEYIFEIVCKKGYLNVAQWLYSIKPNINIFANDHCAFKNACRKGHLNVAQWLQNLFPNKYELIIENNIIASFHCKEHLPLTNKYVSLYYTSKQDLLCPICYDDNQRIGLQTNCKHNFCSTCIRKYYSNCINNLQVCKCPYCRTNITSCNILELFKI